MEQMEDNLSDYFKVMNDINKFGETYIAKAKLYYGHYTGSLTWGKRPTV